jgi:preprotein translocase subunit SecE
MAKEKMLEGGSVWAGLFQFGIYKQTQGRIARQLTFLALAIGVSLAAYQLWLLMKVTSLPAWVPRGAMIESWLALDVSLPILLLVVGLWLSYRAVCIPRFADFLIAVEAEMNKVSWPTRDELIRSSVVVIVIILILSVLLSTYDLVWYVLFQFLGVIQA